MELSLGEKRIIYQILIQIMNADLINQPEEIDFLNEVFNEFELTIDEFDHMDDIDLDYLRKEFSHFSKEKKQYAIDLFTRMAQCDGYVDSRETNLIKLFE